LFRNNGLDIGDTTRPVLYREELDGTASSVTITHNSITAFHHNMELGPLGILAEPDAVGRIEDLLIELAPDGTPIKTWDLAELMETYMRSQGDDPSNFVRRGVDWFHVNSAIYDPTDRSVIVSSRENFVIKLDYDTGAIKWILGDPTKYWYSFPSLRAKALTILSGGLAPIGQHSLSLTPDGQLLMFNNGFESLNMPAGAPAGASRNYSAVTAFIIDPIAMTATPGLTFDDNRSLRSPICSSAYLSEDGSMLINYSQTENSTVLRVKGLNPQQQVVFDFSYPTTFGCASSWNSVIVPFENLRFTN
jgi:hypothetical protein